MTRRARKRIARAAGIAVALLAMAQAPLAAQKQPRPEEPTGPPPPKPTMTIEDYRKLVEARLPRYDGRLLDVAPGPDWFAKMSPEAVAAAVDESLEGTKSRRNGPSIVVTDAAETRFIKLDASRDRVRYASNRRSFDYRTSPRKGIPMDKARDMALATFAKLGLPKEEVHEVYLNTVMGQTSDEKNSPEPPFERERLITAHRAVSGTYVLDSYARFAVSNEGRVSRLVAVWPNFELRPGLKLRERRAVVDDLAEQMWEAMYGIEPELTIHSAYMRVGRQYIPVAAAAISDAKELYAGQLLPIPLVELPPDGDFDSVPDAKDNCVDAQNPGQVDGDGDGVGDACDNCPEAPNRDQGDKDRDGIGDACTPIVGACCVAGECEELPRGWCSESRGDYLGDGTSCSPQACAKKGG